MNDFIASWQQAPKVNRQVGTTYTFQSTDYGQLVTFNNSAAVAATLPQATGSFNPWNAFLQNIGTGTVTVTPQGGSLINGASSLPIAAGGSVWVVSDGTNFQAWLGLTPTSLSPSFDTAFGSTRGSVLERGVSGWQIIPPGTSGLPWVSNGPGADPAYQALTSAGIAAGTVANSNLANMPANTIKCNPTGSSAVPQDCANPTAASITLLPTGVNSALNTTQNLTGSGSVGPVSTNQILINSDQYDNTTTGPASFVNGFYIQHLFGGAAGGGGRQALSVLAQMTAPMGGTTNNRNYVAGTFETFAQASDGGTSGAPQGAYFALNPVAILGASQSFPLELAGTEIDISARAGSGLKYKVGNSVVQLNDDAVQGTTFDAAYMVSAQTGASTVWKNGFQFSNANGQQGVGTGSTLFSSSGSATVNSFIDFSSFTCSGGNEIKFAGFVVGCGGTITSGANGGTGGSLTLNGATSGSGAITIDATGGTLRAPTLSTRQLIPLSSAGVSMVQNTTQFMVAGGITTSETSVESLCPVGGTFKNLFLVSTAPASGQTLTATWRVNNANTAITCTITGTGTTCNDTTHTTTCTQGQSYSLQLVSSATAGTLNFVAGGIEFDNP